MTCASCPWFDALGRPTTCREQSARVYVVRVDVSGQQMLQTPFPPVDASGWCAQHPERRRRAQLDILAKEAL